MTLGIDAMRTMAATFDDAGHALLAADDIRREAGFVSGVLAQESSRGQGKDFDLVLQLGDELDVLVGSGKAATTDAIAGAKAALKAFDESGLPVHFQSRVEIGGARELLANTSGWGGYLEPVGDQFVKVGRAILDDVAARSA